jgi:hypothetical protein
MTKRVAILQSNYLPWKGYFDIIHDVDEFIFHDDLQYTKQDWRNRNRIKTPNGAMWLTIPVGDCEQRLICEVELPAGNWARDHWRKIEASYVHAPHFERYRDLLRDALLGSEWRLLSDLNQHLIRLIARDLLGLKTEFRDSRSLDLGDARKQERVLAIVQKTGSDVYVSGPAAKAYLEPHRFAEAGVTLVWKDYAGYPEYEQLHAPFRHDVTILDLLFHTGSDAPHYIWGWREQRQ